MVYQEKQLKEKRQSSKLAIALAMQGKWKEAVEANKSILNVFPDDVDTFNRLGRAYLELGNFQDAKGAYQKALSLDTYNIIARKNITRLSNFDESGTTIEVHPHNVEPQFIEEAGKSGVANLIRLASPKIVARFVSGDKVYLKIEEGNLLIRSAQGDYIGQVEPKHSQRLIRLINGGNNYSAAIISATENKVTVIIREVYQHPSQIGHPSFPSRWVEELRQPVGDKTSRSELEDEGEESDLSGPETEPVEDFSRSFNETEEPEE